MESRTQTMWDTQNRHPGDRLRLFRSVSEFTGDVPVLYPGSFVDVAASFVFSSVTYVDLDKRAARFFSDRSGVDEIIDGNRLGSRPRQWRFIHSDYQADLALADGSFGLLVSLYAGFVSDHCARYVRSGGWLLANPSHGDVALASIDLRYRLAAVVTSRSGTYEVSDRDLDAYLEPKKPTYLTAEVIRSSGRGIAYTMSPFAYLFERA